MRENSLWQVTPADIMDAARECCRDKSVMGKAANVSAARGLHAEGSHWRATRGSPTRKRWSAR